MVNKETQNQELNTAVMYLSTFPAYRQICMEILSKMECQVSLYCSDAQLDKTVKTGITSDMFTRVPMIRILGKLYIQFGHWSEALSARTLIVDLNPRGLHNWIFLIVRKLSKKRTLVWGHLYPRKGSKSATASIRRAMRALSDGTIVYTRDQMISALEDLRSSPVWVAPNALYSEERLSEPVINERRDQIVYVGRFTNDKKVENLVRGFAQSGLASEGIVLNLIGSGPTQETLEAIRDNLGLGDSVTFSGWIQDFDSLKAHYARAFMSASPGFAGLGLTQSLGFGVPQVVSRNELHSPEIELADTGGVFWAKSSHPSDLAEAMRTVWKMQPRTANKTWIEAVINRYSADKMAKGLFDAIVGHVSDRKQKGIGLKIALLWTFPADYIVANAQAAVEKGHEVILVFQERVQYTPEVRRPESIETLVTPTHSELVTRLETFAPDIIVLPGWNFPSYTKVAFRFHKKAVRVMVTDTQWRATFKQLWGRVIFLLARWRFFDWALIPGERQYQFVRKLGFPHSKIQMGSIPANTKVFSSIKKEYRNTRQFIFVGRLVAEKGVSLLLDAYSIYRQKVSSPWKLVIVGEGYLNQCEIEGVEFRGPLSPEEVSKEMKASSAFVLPSSFEPWAVVIQEAAASGLPIIASDECGAVPHYLHNGLNGFRVKTNSKDDLVQALVSMTELSDSRLEYMSLYSWKLAQNQTQESWVFALEIIFSEELRTSQA